MSTNLKLVGKRAVSSMIEQAKSQFPWKVLVVDEYAMKILTSATKLFDLTEEHISVVEKLSLKRKPMREMDAIYIVAPTEDSVNRIIEDFEPGKKLYNACHLFFISEVSDELFKKMQASPVSKSIKTFKEANFEFLVNESRAFCTDISLDPTSPSSFTKLFSPAFANERKFELDKIGRQLASFCVNLGEYPLIRYSLASTATNEGPLAKLLALSIQNQIDNLYRNDGIEPNLTNRATLLVLDRSFDLTAPFLHEFTYQAMIYDLINIENNKYSYQTTDAAGKSVTKSATLDEEDEKFKDYRHKHIAECVSKIVEEFNVFIKQNESLRSVNKGDGQTKSMKDIGALIRAAPQFTEQLSKFSLHLNLTQAAMSKFTNDKIEDLARVEQCLATKETGDGEPYRGPSVDDLLAAVSHPSRTEDDKARLLLLYIIFKGGISKEERTSLCEKLKLGQRHKDAVEHISTLGIRADLSANKEGKKKGKKEEENAYELSRYVPKLKKILTSLIEGELSSDEYPYTREAPPEDEESRKRGISMRTAKTNWTKNQRKDEGTSSKEPKVIVFIAGGATYSELRTVHEMNACEVFLGTTSMLRPNDFVHQLQTIRTK